MLLKGLKHNKQTYKLKFTRMILGYTPNLFMWIYKSVSILPIVCYGTSITFWIRLTSVMRRFICAGAVRTPKLEVRKTTMISAIQITHRVSVRMRTVEPVETDKSDTTANIVNTSGNRLFFVSIVFRVFNELQK